MRLRNKNTGEIVEFETTIYADTEDSTYEFNSIAELNEEWEDHEDRKSYYYITSIGEIVFRGFALKSWNGGDERRKEIGNYFKTKEEAELAVERLRAWKRLKDKGFRFEGIRQDYTRIHKRQPFADGRKYLQFNKAEDEDWLKENWKDLDTCFGDEEWAVQ